MCMHTCFLPHGKLYPLFQIPASEAISKINNDYNLQAHHCHQQSTGRPPEAHFAVICIPPLTAISAETLFAHDNQPQRQIKSSRMLMLPRQTGSIFLIMGPNEAVSHWKRMSHLCVQVCVPPLL